MSRATPSGAPLLRGLGAAADAGACAHYDDPAYYAHAYRDRTNDIEYYVAAANRLGGDVLEYGAGAGRIAIPIARTGHRITAIDLSEPMLTNLEQRLEGEPTLVRERVNVLQGDMRHIRLNKRFPLVIATFNTFLHLYTRGDVEQFLSGVKHHLAPGGEFIFDYSVPRCKDLSLDPERWYGSPRMRHPTSGKVVNYAERFEYDPMHQVLLMRMRFTPREGGPAQVVPLTHRQFFPQELETLLHYNGFVDQVWTSDFADFPPSAESDSLVIRCRVSQCHRG